MSHLNRRSFLRGLLGGAAVSVALPPFETFMGQKAWAASAFPTRFGLFFWGNGIHPERWIPSTTGADWELSEQLAPLAGVKDDITLLTGFEVKLPNTTPHFVGPAGFLSGMPQIIHGPDDETFGGPSLDQLMASQMGGETLYRSLEVAVARGTRGMSHNGPDSVNPPESDPAKLFERLFGGAFRAPGEEPIIDPTLTLRRSVLDSVLADASSLRGRLGAVDKIRLDQHMSSVRDLELRIARLQEDPPSLAACLRPEPPPELPDIEGRQQVGERARVMADLIAMSLACDQTRVVSLWYSDPLSDLLYPSTTAGHHQLTHDEPGDQPQVNSVVLEIVDAYAYLVDALRNIPEGDGTLLDHCAILGTTDVSEGRTHQIDEYPILLAGQANGALKTGFHYRSATKQNASHVPLTLLRAMGVNAASYGAEDAHVTDGLSEIEA